MKNQTPPVVYEISARAKPADGVELIDADSVKVEPIHWLWPGWLARGKLHVYAGAPGTGKTTIALHIAACVSAGRPLPSGFRPTPGNVIIWSGEDDCADTLAPRLRAAGADMSRIRFVGEVTQAGQRFPFDPARDVGKLDAAAAKVGDVALLIVDPVVNAISGDSHRNAEVRRGLAPLVELAAKLNAALIGITHFSKGTAGRDPVERVTGSIAFGALARIVCGTVRQDAGEGAQRAMMFARAKSNIGPDGGGYTYSFEHVEVADGVIANCIVWGASVEGTPRELLADSEPKEDDASESGECANWLREELETGEQDAATMQREAANLGYSPKVIRRAREKLGVKPRKGDFKKGWVWALPSTEDAQRSSEHAQDAQQNEVGAFDDGGHLRDKAAPYLQPQVTCSECAHFIRDRINPLDGMGRCGAGCDPSRPWPNVRRQCAAWRPNSAA